MLPKLQSFFTFLFLMNASMASELIVNSKVSEVTVYRNFAKEVRVSSTNLPEGQHEIILKNVSSQIDPNSIQVSLKGSASLLTVFHRFNAFNEEEKTIKNKKFIDSLERLNDELAWITEQKNIFKQEEVLMNSNLKLGGEKAGFTAAEVEVLAKSYRVRLYDIKSNQQNLIKKERAVVVLRDKVQNYLNQINAESASQSSEIVLKVMVKEAGLASIKCAYMMNNAGWEPIYDIRANNTQSPVNLQYKAKVRQNSGYDWKNVSMTISTGNPAANNDRPILNPLYLDFAPQYGYGQRMEKAVMAAAPAMEEDVKLNMGGARMDAQDNAWATKTIVTENAVNAEFKIDVLQDIKSDGQEYIVFIQGYDIPATYTYHSVPKLEQTAFLLAKLTQWGKYNLIPGEANIFFKDMFVGKSAIDPNLATDTLLLSLGRDERISIKRTKLNDYDSKNVFGTTKKEQYAFETVVKNNNSFPVDIEILDQLPISKNAQIEVKLIESSAAIQEAEIGKMMWNIRLMPNQSRIIRLIYEVKSPNGKAVEMRN